MSFISSPPYGVYQVVIRKVRLESIDKIVVPVSVRTGSCQAATAAGLAIIDYRVLDGNGQRIVEG
jgi:hypothetical protein